MADRQGAKRIQSLKQILSIDIVEAVEKVGRRHPMVARVLECIRMSHSRQILKCVSDHLQFVLQLPGVRWCPLSVAA